MDPLPTFQDPFLVPRRKEEAPKPLAPAAFAAFLLAWLPIGSFVAPIVGWVGVRQTRSRSQRGRSMAIAAIVIGLLSSGAYGALGVLVVWPALDKAGRREDPHANKDTSPKEAATASAPASRLSGIPADPAGTVPQKTQTTRIGDLTIVDLGVREPNLRAALIREIASASAEGREVLVVTTRANCEPCAGVAASLDKPLMQFALARSRVVRVNVQVFEQELKHLRISHDPLPGFFLLNPDGTARDGIDGGEWGADVAENISPVLGPFVRGELRTRKKPFGAAGPGTAL